VNHLPELKVVKQPGDQRLGVSPAPTVLPLQLDNLCYQIDGQTLLKNISLTIEDEPATLILGPNGAGKTLLLRVCHGLLLPTRGSLVWHDPALAASVGAQAMVFQRPVMLRRTVAQNILYAMRACGVARSDREQRLQDALQISGLNRFARRSAARLSGGEQQRLALARCVAIRPRILFLDEPTAHLDPTATRQVENMIVAMREAGTRLMMVTHDLGQARRLADRILFMYRGRVLEYLRAADFLDHPVTSEANAYLTGDLLW